MNADVRSSQALSAPPLLLGSPAFSVVRPSCAGRADHGSVADYPERWRSPFTQVEMREMWTYSDGARTAEGYWWPGGTARAGSWVLVDQATGNVQPRPESGESGRHD